MVPSTWWARATLALVVLACNSGCAVGLARYSISPREPAPRAVRGAAERVTLIGGYPDVTKALDRALTERLGVREVLHEKERAATSGIAIRVVQDYESSGLSTASLLLSLFSLSVVPGYGASEQRIALTVEAPGQAARTFEYRYRESTVVWLPLLLIGPDFVAGLNGGWVRQEPMDRVYREIAERFAEDAAALIAPAPPRAEPSG